MRQLQKYAVTIGGGKNHRKNLSDGILVKDNHLNILAKSGNDFKSIISKALQNSPSNLKVEVEVSNIDEVEMALDAGAHIIMLDNMSLQKIKEAVQLIDGRVRIEVSGTVSLANIADLSKIGIDCVSVGALTHSSKAADISMNFINISN